MTAAVFLDRDGVLNRTFVVDGVPLPPRTARGKQTVAAVDRLNGELRRRLPLDDVLVCPHDDQDGCDCRKPRPGMLLAAARLHGVDLAGSIMVGDRDKDVEAGRAAGCRTVFVDGGYGRPPQPPADLTVPSLREAVPWIISQGRSVIGGQ